MEIFEIRNLTFSYPEQEKRVLDDLSFSLHQGDFVTLCGPSGCGKSTLLRQLKTTLTPHGRRSGEILIAGRNLTEVSQREQSERIGFVMQNPDNQIVTDKVWHELAFGLESLGYDTPTIRGRVAEMASFFGIQNWFYKDVAELSGGQKQLLNLAAIMAMQPAVLILDEPTSQLDPIAAADFLATVGKINRELGTTVIMTEHRLEEVFPMSNRALVMEDGRLVCDGSPAEVGKALKDKGSAMFLAMPAPMRIYAAVPNELECPVTVREGRDWLTKFAETNPLGEIPDPQTPDFTDRPVTVELQEVWFRYEKDAPDVVKGLSLQAHAGELLAILGGNGAGKTTTLSLIAGLNKPYRGKVLINGEETTGGGFVVEQGFGVLPQNPQTLFLKKTVREDLLEILSGKHMSKEEKAKRLQSAIRLCRLEQLLERHPYDLSGGEQQRAALAKVLLLHPKILLLDEPTKGLDSEFKQELAGILQDLTDCGVTVIMVSHDIEFCADYAHRCAMFFDGGIVTADRPREFFSGNNFYTTAANRMARCLLPQAVTAEDVIVACGGKPAPPVRRGGGDDDENDDLKYYALTGETAADPAEKAKQKLPWWRRILAAVAGASAALTALSVLYEFDLPFLPTTDEDFLGTQIVLICSLLVLILAVSRQSKQPIANEQTAVGKRKLSKRTLAAALMVLLVIPLTIFIGYYYFGDRKYYFISLLIILETMLPFAMIFEQRKPQPRELVIIAVLCVIAVAGRAAFFMLPQFKPVVALVII